MAVDVHIWGTISLDARPSWSEQKWQYCQIWQVTWAVPNLEPLKLHEGDIRSKTCTGKKGYPSRTCKLTVIHENTFVVDAVDNKKLLTAGLGQNLYRIRTNWQIRKRLNSNSPIQWLVLAIQCPFSVVPIERVVDQLKRKVLPTIVNICCISIHTKSG